MSTPKFAEVHNLVAFLSKPTKSEGFEQIVNFLNANPIKYALTVNPTVYNSCIEQLWATVKVKTINGGAQLQALVDEKKVIITESTIRRDLQLEDTGGVDCLPNDVIFKQLALMGFVQVFLNNQLEWMANHTRIYVTHSHTKKIFRNMRRVGKEFSRRVIPLFPTMMVQAQEEMGEGSINPTDPHHTPTIIQPSTSQSQRKQKPRKTKRKVTKIPHPSDPTEHVTDEAVNKEMDGSLVRAATTATSLNAEQDRGVNTPQSGEDSIKLNELMEICTTLQSSVLALENTKTTQALEIESLKRIVKKLEKRKSVDVIEQAKEVVADRDIINDITLAKDLMEIKNAKPKADKVVIQEPEQGTTTTITATRSSPKAKGIVIHEQEQAPTSKVSSQQPSQKLKDLKNKSFNTIKEMFDQAFKRVNAFINYMTKLVEESSKKAKAEITQEGSSKRVGDELEQERSKKQKVNDDKEFEELKQCLEIIPDDGDDVTIDAHLYLLKSDPSKDPSSDHIPPLPATSSFLSSADDTTDSDTPDTPPSPTHDTPFTEITSSTQR
nr:hypothetical protein [Tanacetum cinerariifolium]